MENKLSNGKEYFKHGKLLYEIYERLLQEDKISLKGQEDIRFRAFGGIYYSLVENPWKSIGITKDLLKELQSNNFKHIRPDGKKILMTRSHIYDRAKFFKSLFLDKTAKKTIDQLLSFLWHKDITVMSLKEENKPIQEILKKKGGGGYLFPDQGYKYLFPAKTTGFKYTKKVQEELSNFWLNQNKESITTNDKKGSSFEIINKWN
jgi:hypothetical protein